MEKASNKKNGPAPKGSGDTVRTHEHYFTFYQNREVLARERREV